MTSLDKTTDAQNITVNNTINKTLNMTMYTANDQSSLINDPADLAERDRRIEQLND